jgi:hypothetical protein
MSLLSKQQRKVLEYLAENGPVVPYAVRISKLEYSTARLACEYLARKGLAEITIQPFTRKSSRHFYAPSLFGLLELCSELTEIKTSHILKREQNERILPLCRVFVKLDESMQSTFIRLLRETWIEFKRRNLGVFSTLSKFPNGITAMKLVRTDEGEFGLDLEKLEKAEGRDYVEAIGRMDAMSGSVRMLALSDQVDAFYETLFTHPLRSIGSDGKYAHPEFRELILQNNELRESAKRVFKRQKLALAVKIERIKNIEREID